MRSADSDSPPPTLSGSIHVFNNGTAQGICAQTFPRNAVATWVPMVAAEVTLRRHLSDCSDTRLRILLPLHAGSVNSLQLEAIISVLSHHTAMYCSSVLSPSIAHVVLSHQTANVKWHHKFSPTPPICLTQLSFLSGFPPYLNPDLILTKYGP
jgi:hypothetical protein